MKVKLRRVDYGSHYATADGRFQVRPGQFYGWLLTDTSVPALYDPTTAEPVRNGRDRSFRTLAEARSEIARRICGGVS